MIRDLGTTNAKWITQSNPEHAEGVIRDLGTTNAKCITQSNLSIKKPPDIGGLFDYLESLTLARNEKALG